MHVCLITSGRPSEVLYGGEEKFTISFGSWLVNQGNKTTIVGRKLFGVKVIKPNGALPTEPKMKLTQPRVIHLPYPMYVLCMLITSLFFILQVIAINCKSRISIIHAQDTGYGGLSAIVSAKMLRVPVIISSHGIRYFTIKNTVRGFHRTLLSPFEYWLDNITTKTAHSIILVSSSAVEFFAKLGIKKGKMRVIPIGVKTDCFMMDEEMRRSVRNEFNIQDEVVIGFVGRLSPEKNIFILLEAFAKALKYADKMNFILVGTGSIEGKLKILSHSKGINDKVIFTGVRYDVKRLLSALDIFALPSYTEGCPTALLEAMASGKAIVASDIPAIREIVEDGKEALLFNPHNPEQLKDAILKLYNDPKVRKKLGENAKKKAKQYDVNVVFPKVLQVYQEILRKI